MKPYPARFGVFPADADRASLINAINQHAVCVMHRFPPPSSLDAAEALLWRQSHRDALEHLLDRLHRGQFKECHTHCGNVLYTNQHADVRLGLPPARLRRDYDALLLPAGWVAMDCRIDNAVRDAHYGLWVHFGQQAIWRLCLHGDRGMIVGASPDAFEAELHCFVEQHQTHAPDYHSIGSGASRLFRAGRLPGPSEVDCSMPDEWLRTAGLR